jgi:hypothetical protein
LAPHHWLRSTSEGLVSMARRAGRNAAIDDTAMFRADRRHVDDLSLDQLDACVRREHADLGHAVVLVDRDAVPPWPLFHGRAHRPLPWRVYRGTDVVMQVAIVAGRGCGVAPGIRPFEGVTRAAHAAAASAPGRAR